MKVLVINCGSSSLKYQLINMENEEVLAKGIVERIGLSGSFLKHQPFDKEKMTIEGAIPSHVEALKYVVETLVNKEYGVIADMSEISACGHRVAHSGEKFDKSVIIDADVMKEIKGCFDIAPLHNPPNVMGIDACVQLMPNVPQIAVFDTAFHQTMPKHAYMYAIPYEYYEKYRIRRYGFHGTSHKYVSAKAAEFMGKKHDEIKVVTLHLGNGASVAAVKNAKSIDTSMGFTPLEGLAMGTRCGDLDPAIGKFIAEKEGLNISEIDSILNKKSGMLGLSQLSSDFRDVEDASLEGNEKAKVALDLYCYRVKKYIGAYAAAMNGLDAIVFTGGVGENSDVVRNLVCNDMDWLGIEIDSEKNKVRGKEADISKDGTKVRVLVIPTNEELVIARDTKMLVSK